MRKLIAWNLMTLGGRFEGDEPWQLDFQETGGVILRCGLTPPLR